MRAKEYLLQYGKALHEKEDALAELEEKRQSLAGLHAIQLTDMPKAKNHLRDLSDAFAVLEDSAKRCSDIIIAAEETMRNISLTVQRVPDPAAREVLHCKYIRGYSWREIMLTTGHSRTWAHYAHKEGLKIIDELLDS